MNDTGVDVERRREQIPQSLFAEALEAVSEGSLITDAEQNILYSNAAFSRITGYAQSEVIGLNCRLLQGPDTDPATVAEMSSVLRSGQTFRGDVLNYRKDGSTFWNAVTVTPILGGAGEITQFVSVQRDVTGQVEHQERLRFQAMHDSVTALPNRGSFEEQLERCLARARRAKTTFAVAIIDLDDFKVINDARGHQAGDGVLREVADRLSRHVRVSDFVARIGGDEFAVLLEDFDTHTAAAQVHAVFARLRDAVDVEFRMSGGKGDLVGMSAGVALYPADGTDSRTLIARADEALYLAKAREDTSHAWWRLAG